MSRNASQSCMSRQLFVSPASPSAFGGALRRTAVGVAEAVSLGCETASRAASTSTFAIAIPVRARRQFRARKRVEGRRKRTGPSGRHQPRPQPIHLRAVASETQVVIAVRADLPAISKPRRMLMACVADVTFTATTAGGPAMRLSKGWGHLTSSTRILKRRSDRRGHTPSVRLRREAARPRHGEARAA